MYLGTLIEKLEALPQDLVLARGFGAPHSWRGVYAEVAFEPLENVTVASMLAHARSAVDETFEGYKGGHYKMYNSTECHVANYGEVGEDPLSVLLLDAWAEIGRLRGVPTDPNDAALARYAEMELAPADLLNKYMEEVPESKTVRAVVSEHAGHWSATLEHSNGYTFCLATVVLRRGSCRIVGFREIHETPEALDAALGGLFRTHDLGATVASIEAM